MKYFILSLFLLLCLVRTTFSSIKIIMPDHYGLSQFKQGFSDRINKKFYFIYYLSSIQDYDLSISDDILYAIYEDINDDDIVVIIGDQVGLQLLPLNINAALIVYVGIPTSKIKEIIDEYDNILVVSFSNIMTCDVFDVTDQFIHSPITYVLYDNTFISNHLKNMLLNSIDNDRFVHIVTQCDLIDFLKRHRCESIYVYLLLFSLDEGEITTSQIYEMINKYTCKAIYIAPTKYLTCNYTCLGCGVDYFETGQIVADFINQYYKTKQFPENPQTLPFKKYINPDKCDNLQNFIYHEKLLEEYDICQ